MTPVTIQGKTYVMDEGLGYYVLESDAMRIEKVEESLTAEQTGNGEITKVRTRVVTAVRIDEMQALAEAERLKFKREIWSHIRYIANALLLFTVLIVVIGGIAIIRAIWERKDIIAEMGATAIGTVIEWAIYILAFTILAFFLKSAASSMRTSRRFESTDEEPVYGSKRKSTASGNSGNVGTKIVQNNVIVNVGADFTGNESDAQSILNQR